MTQLSKGIMATKYKTLLFDMGGVLLTSPFDIIDSNNIHNSEDISPKDLKIILKSRYFQLLECNLISHKQFEDYVNTIIPGKTDLFWKFLWKLERNIKPRKEIWNLFPKLKEMGYRIAILSNNWYIPRNFIEFDSNDTIEEDRLIMKNSLKYVDFYIQSRNVNMRKPDYTIYHYTYWKLQCSPSEILFFDDLQINLKTASKIGFDCVKVETSNDILEALNQKCNLKCVL